MFNVLNNFFYDYHLSYISYRISNIKNVKDITYIIQNITFFFKNATSDTIITILTDCFEKYPLTEKNTRNISILHQNYEFSNGKEDYCCFVLWISIVYSINNNYKSLL